MERLLITGGLGHIGSKLIHSIEPGQFVEIKIVDNLSTMRYSSFFNLPEGVNYKLYDEDILEFDFYKLLESIDVVIHLAAITDATNSFHIKDQIKSVNYLGTKRLAEACIAQNVKLIFPSTTSVYGQQSEMVDEECNGRNLHPQSPYAYYKLKSEEMLLNMGDSQNLKFIICRFGTIFGQSIGMRFHTAVNKFCWQAAMGKPLTVWETAFNQKRPYLGVNDAVNAIKFIIDQNLFDNQIYNVVSSNHTVREIVELIKKIIPDLNINFINTEIMNQLSYEVDSNKIRACGFIARDDIDIGIKETINQLLNRSPS